MDSSLDDVVDCTEILGEEEDEESRIMQERPVFISPEKYAARLERMQEGREVPYKATILYYFREARQGSLDGFVIRKSRNTTAD